MRRLGLVLSALSLCGCSLLRLSDDLGGRSCSTEPGLCASLDVERPTGDACLTWQCVEGHCAVDLRDDDADGAPAPMCAPAGDPVADCDDAAADNTPGAAEACDGRDGDCDGRVDEGRIEARLMPLGDALGAVEVAHVAWASEASGDELLALYSTTSGVAVLRTDRALVAPSQSDVAVRVEGGADVPGVRGLALAAVPGAGTVVARVPLGCPRVVLGVLSVGPPAAIDFDGADFDAGLPKPGGDCPADASPVALPALGAGDDGGLLAAWLAASDASTRECGAALAADVVVASAQRTGTGVAPSTAPPVVLGRSVDHAAPAVLATRGGFLVGFVDADDGAIVVHRVTLVDAGTGALGASLVHREAAAAGMAGDVVLAAGDEVHVALGWSEGCGAAARAHVRRLLLGADAVTVEGPRWDPEGEATQPRLVYDAAFGQWALAAVSRTELVVSVLDAASDVMVASRVVAGAAGGGRPFLLERGRGAAYVTAAWARGTGGSAGVFSGAALGCRAE